MSRKTQRAKVVVAMLLAATGCTRIPGSSSGSPVNSNVAAAERVIDAFYSFDVARLRDALGAADSSAPAILYYQGWAEGGHYRVRQRLPCQPESPDTIRCAITVEDDLIKALRLEIFVTDTFRIKVIDGLVRQVATSSNDPPLFEEALAWTRRERSESIRVPCAGFFAGGPTPGACVQAIARAFAEFSADRQGR